MKLETGSIIALVMFAVFVVIGLGLVVGAFRIKTPSPSPSLRQVTSMYNTDNSKYSADM